MHFVYKLDHLFQSTRVWDENSSVQRHFIFLNLFNSRLFFHPTCNIQRHILKFQPFLNSFAIFHAFYDLFLAKWPWNWKALKPGLGKGWNLARYHHLTYITCVQKLRGLRQKLDVLRVQTGPSPSKYEGFGWKLIYWTYSNFIIGPTPLCKKYRNFIIGRQRKNTSLASRQSCSFKREIFAS